MVEVENFFSEIKSLATQCLEGRFGGREEGGKETQYANYSLKIGRH